MQLPPVYGSRPLQQVNYTSRERSARTNVMIPSSGARVNSIVSVNFEDAQKCIASIRKS